jgi:hypothetical protein
MAPSAIDITFQEQEVFTYDNPSKLVFPDGIKTSGQFDPNYDQIKQYNEFPIEITGPTVWEAADYANNLERWTHRFSEEEVEEMSNAADAFIASDTPLTGITKVCFLKD